MSTQVIRDTSEKGKEKRMNTVVQFQEKSTILSSNLEEMLIVVKQMYADKLTIPEFHIFAYACKRTGLDPAGNQIYPIVRGSDEKGNRKMVIQTGIDGFRLIAERTERYSPGKEPVYEYDQQGKLVSATSFIKKQTSDGTWHDVSAKAYWNEYAQIYNGKPAQFWAKMPHVMLAKCAEAIALRKAFPADFSGIYTTEEMGQSDNVEIVNTPVQENSEQIAHSPDLTIEELNAYIQKEWSEYSAIFMDWINEWKKEMTYRRCVEMIEKNKEKSKSSLDKKMVTHIGI